MEDITIYVFVRGDLSEEDQMVQALHAVQYGTHYFYVNSGWTPDNPKIVALDGGSSERAFMRTESKLKKKGLRIWTYCDSDHPEWGITAMCTDPLDPIRASVLSNYRLRRYAPIEQELQVKEA